MRSLYLIEYGSICSELGELQNRGAEGSDYYINSLKQANGLASSRHRSKGWQFRVRACAARDVCRGVSKSTSARQPANSRLCFSGSRVICFDSDCTVQLSAIREAL